MTSPPSPIASFEDWSDAVRQLGKHQGHNAESPRLVQALGVPAAIPTPPVTAGPARTIDDLQLQELGWQLPYGPPTRGYLLTPAQANGSLPGVLWLHCHGGNKWLGAERLVDAGNETIAEVRAVQRDLYSGRAVANELARAGFAVLVHDSFSWGSRRFLLNPPPPRVAEGLAARRALWREECEQPTPAMEYNAAAAIHEHTIAKTAGLLGTSYAGMVAFEDLAALDILRNLPGIENGSVGVGGFSGGGGRVLVLSALAPEVHAAVVCCMMTTFKGLFPSHMDAHSWLLATAGLASSFIGRSSRPSMLRAVTSCSTPVRIRFSHPKACTTPTQGSVPLRAVCPVAISDPGTTPAIWSLRTCCRTRWSSLPFPLSTDRWNAMGYDAANREGKRFP